jgi:hypothetical protein
MYESVLASIASQEVRHRKIKFEEEFRTLQQKHGMPFNEWAGLGLIRLSPAPFQGDLRETLSPGLKPRAESSCPFTVENPLRKLS